MRSHKDGYQPQPKFKAVGFVAGLFLLVIVAVGFTVSIVQIQSAVAAYIGGESIWSRAQLTAVDYFDRYAKSGNPSDLRQARDWLAIPLSDLDARLAMEEPVLDAERARAGILGGKNHPNDVAGMIWMFRYLSEFGEFRKATIAWRNTDVYLLELSQIGDYLEAEWGAPQTSQARIDELCKRLADVSSELRVYAARFRMAMVAAAMWTTDALSFASIVFMLFLALMAWGIGRRLTRLIHRSAQNFHAIFEQAAVGIAQVDAAGGVLDVNRTMSDILGYSRQQLLTMRYRDLVHPEDWELGRQQQREVAVGNLDSYTFEQRLVHGSGEPLWVRLTVSITRHQGNRTPNHIVVMEDISESRRLSTELNYQANHDMLTGLLNRRAFERHLTASLSRARADCSHHALCFLDLDQFKVVNDTSGHGAGDELLRQVADVARQTLRADDMLARLGGDEFGVILDNCTLDTAAMIAEKLRSALEQITFVWEGRSHSVGCSIGVVPITPAVVDIGSLLRAADIACYMAKDQGRNRIYLSSENDQQVSDQRVEMEWLNRIQKALNENRFFLDAQLIVPSEAGHKGLRYEVLIRLRNEEGETVPPNAFLPAAERFGIIHRIDRWVISEVVQQLAAHPAHLDNLDACHVNLSGRSFDQPDFGDFIVELLEYYQLPAGKICFEITETAAVHNLVDVQVFMERLRVLGCDFALDDFGTGLSSFSYLRRLPVDYLKIDGVFVRDIVNNKTDLAMVRAINDIGQTLNKKTIAEFVEDEETHELLRKMGVDYVQGFGPHRPCRFADVLSGKVLAHREVSTK